MHATLFRAESEASTLVISPYGVLGCDTNTGPRYLEEARLTGFDILGITRMGSDTFRFQPELRNQLSPHVFDDFIASQADQIAAYSQDYERIIGRAQSAGSFLMFALIKSGGIKFSHLVVEDGVNTFSVSSSGSMDYLRGLSTFARYKHAESKNMPRPPEQGWYIPSAAPIPLREKVAKFIVEQAHWGPLWNSSDSRESLLEIVKQSPEIAVLAKFFGHTNSGTPRTIHNYIREIEAATDERESNYADAADVIAEYDPKAWHGYIEYPQFGASNLLSVAGIAASEKN